MGRHLFPVVGTTTIYAAAALAVNAFTVAYLSRPGFEWLIRRRSHRILVACLLTLAPGAGVTFLNISNLTNCLGLLALLMLIETPRDLGPAKFAALVGIGLSSGHMVILLPLILYLWIRAAPGRLLLLCALPIIIARLLGNRRREPGPACSTTRGSQWHLAIVENFVVRLLFAPFLVELTSPFLKTPAWIFWPLAVVAVAAARRTAGASRPGTIPFGLSYLFTVSTFGSSSSAGRTPSEGVQRESGTSCGGAAFCRA